MPTVETLKLYVAHPEVGDEVFVSLEHTPVVLADIRAALPQLKKDLSSRWPIVGVDIENRLPRRRNPAHPVQTAEVIAYATVGIRILLGETAQAIGKAVVREIGEYVRGWIRQVTQVAPRIPTRNHSRRKCECGCGEYPKSPKSRFLPGHDLRKAYKETVGGSRKAKR